MIVAHNLLAMNANGINKSNSKYNILEQAGISMMTQANQSNQGVLSLLQ